MLLRRWLSSPPSSATTARASRKSGVYGMNVRGMLRSPYSQVCWELGPILVSAHPCLIPIHRSHNAQCLPHRNSHARARRATESWTRSALKARQPRLQARRRGPRLLHRRRGDRQRADPRLWHQLPYPPRPDRELGPHGAVLGADDLQVPPCGARGPLLPPGACPPRAAPLALSSNRTHDTHRPSPR